MKYNHIQSFALKRPLLSLPLITLGLIVTQVTAGIALSIGRITTINPVALVYVITSVMLCGILTRGHRWRSAGFVKPRASRNVWLGLAATGAIVLTTLAISVGWAEGFTAGTLLPTVGSAIVIAFAEEVIFRGLALASFMSRGPLIATALSSTAFAASHLANIFTVPAERLGWLLLSAFLIGAVLAFMTLLTASLWPALVVHFGIGVFSVGAVGLWSPDGNFIPFLAALFACAVFLGLLTVRSSRNSLDTNHN